MTDTLLTHRCPCCGATANKPGAELPQCDTCGHGMVKFEVTQ